MWWWVLIWVLLVLVAAAYLAMRGWAVWGQVKELRTEVARASEVASALEVQVDRIGESPLPASSVFLDPRTVREDLAGTRAGLREERRARRDATMPGWARRQSNSRPSDT